MNFSFEFLIAAVVLVICIWFLLPRLGTLFVIIRNTLRRMLGKNTAQWDDLAMQFFTAIIQIVVLVALIVLCLKFMGLF